MLESYRQHVAERAALGIPPLPLSAQQTADLVLLLKNPPAGEEEFLLDLITNRVPAGVDDAAKVKSAFLAAIVNGSDTCKLIDRKKATFLLGTMLGGFNIKPMIDALNDAEVGEIAAEALSKTLLMFDYFHDVKELADKGSATAKKVMQSWADAEWFTSRPEVPTSIKLTVFKVTGETNTDDLSPAPDAWSRPDIPLHALAMLKNPRPGIEADEPGKVGPIKQLQALIAKGNPIAYVRRRRWYRFIRASQPPTACCGSQAMTFRSSRTSVSVAIAWATKLLRFSSTPWKTQAHCQSSWMSARWTWVTKSNYVPLKARP